MSVTNTYEQSPVVLMVDDSIVGTLDVYKRQTVSSVPLVRCSKEEVFSFFLQASIFIKADT